MDSFTIVKSKEITLADATKQLSKFIAQEETAKQAQGEIINTTRARISDDVFGQLQITCAALQEQLDRQ